MRRVNWRLVRILLFSVYCLFILWVTLLSRTPDVRMPIEWRLMWSYRELLAGDPNAKGYVLQNIANILFFIPFGLLWPFSAEKAEKKKRLVSITTAALLFSIAIEGTQHCLHLGLCELDDVICNGLGGLIGAVIGSVIRKRINGYDVA